jgi:hypothetical protein
VDGSPAGQKPGGTGQQKAPSKDFRIARIEMLIPPGKIESACHQGLNIHFPIAPSLVRRTVGTASFLSFGKPEKVALELLRSGNECIRLSQFTAHQIFLAARYIGATV